MNSVRPMSSSVAALHDNVIEISIADQQLRILSAGVCRHVMV